MFNYFIDAVTKHYVDFSGRSRRAAFWYFYLVYIIIAIVLSVIQNLVHLNGVLSGIWALAMFLPTLGIAVRRYHDSNHSGWWIICPLMNIIFLFFAGTPGPNAYGPDPKAGA